MADMFTKRKRSEIMSHIRSKNTTPELLLFELAKELWREGYRYRKHYKKLPGTPDLAFPAQKVAVFIDSEFWHGKDFAEWRDRLPKEYWRDKIERNIKRDKEIDSELDSLGWTVIRFWAKELKKSTNNHLEILRKCLC